MASDFLSQLDWRNATKDFDAEKKVSEGDLGKILKAVRMAPTSYGLQPFHVVVISNPELKAKLREHAFGQAQIEDSSHLFVFCARTDLPERIKGYFDIASGGDAAKREAMSGYESMMNGFAEGKTADQVLVWAAKQAYIALGFAMAACAEMNIDSCPMEGFDPAQFDKVLGLSPELRSVVVLAVGYRKSEPQYEKVRFDDTDLFTIKS